MEIIEYEPGMDFRNSKQVLDEINEQLNKDWEVEKDIYEKIKELLGFDDVYKFENVQ